MGALTPRRSCARRSRRTPTSWPGRDEFVAPRHAAEGRAARAREARHRAWAGSGHRPGRGTRGAAARRRPARAGRPDDPLRHRRRARRRPLPGASSRRFTALRGARSARAPGLRRARRQQRGRPSASRPRTSTWCAAASRSTGSTRSRSDPAERGLEPALSLRVLGGGGQALRAGRQRRATGAAGGPTGPPGSATLPIGYGDGWRRGLSNDCDVLIGGRRHPLVGTISMDNITVDLGAGHRRRAGRRRRC